MGDVVEFPLIVVNGKRVRLEIPSGAPQTLAANDETETPPSEENEDDDELIDRYVAQLCEAKSPQVYLDILKEFLCEDEYEMVLLAIMDSEYFDDLDELGVTFVNGYFKLMGFEPDDDPRAA